MKETSNEMMQFAIETVVDYAAEIDADETVGWMNEIQRAMKEGRIGEDALDFLAYFILALNIGGYDVAFTKGGKWMLV